jgi:hypothetical protein
MIASTPSAGADLGLPDAARHFGVSVRVLRHAMRAGALPCPVPLTATTALPRTWLAEAEAAVKQKPGLFKRGHAAKVPPFARYKGTSAWQKFRTRARAYAEYRAANPG